MHHNLKYKKINRGKFDPGRSACGPPGIPWTYKYEKTRFVSYRHVIHPLYKSFESTVDPEMSSTMMKSFHADSRRGSLVKTMRLGGGVYSDLSSKEVTNYLYYGSPSLTAVSHYAVHKAKNNQPNCGWGITKSSEYHRLEGGVV
jgi:hypothetical protein